MKKIFLLLAICLSAVAVEAQNQAVGLRAGGSIELLYERDLSADRCKWTDWTPRTCDWYLNAGVGAALGAYKFKDAGFLVGAVGSVAFGCRFRHTPISLEVDYRPMIGAVAGGDKKGFYKPGLWNFGGEIPFLTDGPVSIGQRRHGGFRAAAAFFAGSPLCEAVVDFGSEFGLRASAHAVCRAG